MRVTVHDVGHGACISLVHENGNVMLWDCGNSDANQPSRFLPSQGVQKIDRLFITNYDQDHISDLPALRDAVSIPTLHRNNSISAEQLRTLKRQSGPITNAMDSLLNMIETYTLGPPDPPPPFPNVTYTTFWNSYDTDFDDTNNISMVTVLECSGLKFIIPGDIETEGWRKLLEKEAFRRALQGTRVFVASHHGRENGYCPEVFNYCTPDAVIFSDSSIQYATQEMSSTYATQASGTTFNGQPRRVLSTRNDGSIWWDL